MKHKFWAVVGILSTAAWNTIGWVSKGYIMITLIGEFNGEKRRVALTLEQYISPLHSMTQIILCT